VLVFQLIFGGGLSFFFFGERDIASPSVRERGGNGGFFIYSCPFLVSLCFDPLDFLFFLPQVYGAAFGEKNILSVVRSRSTLLVPAHLFRPTCALSFSNPGRVKSVNFSFPNSLRLFVFLMIRFPLTLIDFLKPSCSIKFQGIGADY